MACRLPPPVRFGPAHFHNRQYNLHGISLPKRRRKRMDFLTLLIPSAVDTLKEMSLCLSCSSPNSPKTCWPKYGRHSQSVAGSLYCDVTTRCDCRDLVDINGDGKLTRDGFAVALHLINGKLGGKEIPQSLPLSLVPPSMRKGGTTTSGVVAQCETFSYVHPFFISLTSIHSTISERSVGP